MEFIFEALAFCVFKIQFLDDTKDIQFLLALSKPLAKQRVDTVRQSEVGVAVEKDEPWRVFISTQGLRNGFSIR